MASIELIIQEEKTLYEASLAYFPTWKGQQAIWGLLGSHAKWMAEAGRLFSWNALDRSASLVAEGAGSCSFLWGLPGKANTLQEGALGIYLLARAVLFQAPLEGGAREQMKKVMKGVSVFCSSLAKAGSYFLFLSPASILFLRSACSVEALAGNFFSLSSKIWTLQALSTFEEGPLQEEEQQAVWASKRLCKMELAKSAVSLVSTALECGSLVLGIGVAPKLFLLSLSCSSALLGSSGDLYKRMEARFAEVLES